MWWTVVAAIHLLLVDPTPEPAAPVGSGADDLVNWIAPIASTGLVGVFLLMVLLRIKIMPTYVYDTAEKTWEAERGRLTAENTELKEALRNANLVYTSQVIPTLTRVLDAERELVELRRDEAAERRRRHD